MLLVYPAPGAAARSHSAIAPEPLGVPVYVAKPLATGAPTGYQYTVQPGDTAWAIAHTHGVSVDALLAANGLSDSAVLQSGQVIFVPAEPPTAPATKTAATVAQQPEPAAAQLTPTRYQYTVQPGDTVWAIAVAHGLSVDALLVANGLNGSTVLQPGQSIFVPAERPAAAPAQPQPAAAPPQPEPAAAPPAPTGYRYTVQPGDTLWAIAQAHDLSVDELLAASGLSSSSVLQLGQEIFVPAPRPAQAQSQAAQPAADTTYTVRRGDTLWDIAHANGLSVDELLAANGLRASSVLQPGQSLTVPGAGAKKSAATKTAAGYTYTVRQGDTLWDIAEVHNLTVDELLVSNPGASQGYLRPGQTLLVPAQPAAMTRKTAAPPPAPEQAPAPAAAQTNSPPPNDAPKTPAPEAAPAASAPATQAAPAPPAPAPAQPDDAAASLVAQMNEKRAAAGLAALVWSPDLAAAAQGHADDCARRNWGSHVGSDGAALRARLSRAGFAAKWAGENWAYAASAGRAFSMWWNEPPGNDPHRRSILNPNYREVGIGIAKAPWGYFFIADFGSR